MPLLYHAMLGQHVGLVNIKKKVNKRLMKIISKVCILYMSVDKKSNNIAN